MVNSARPRKIEESAALQTFRDKAEPVRRPPASHVKLLRCSALIHLRVPVWVNRRFKHFYFHDGLRVRTERWVVGKGKAVYQTKFVLQFVVPAKKTRWVVYEFC